MLNQVINKSKAINIAEDLNNPNIILNETNLL